MNRDNGAVVPPNLSSDVYTNYTADNIDINDSTLDEAMEKLIPANNNEGKTCPVFAKCVKIEWYTVEKDESDIAQQARAIDMSYLVMPQNKETCPSWSAFNQSLSKRSAENAAITTVGYMPIIQAPAHEIH
ncbi:Hypothetical predicted protein [Paramuricea clavata]|uniref:Uncharacterized protein n=1 Tax=Paramuricea clavata TaxID=317549 RepID=A0A7D9HHR7_PARCT|nr:Hypothetical predicted protein [Paramuricea clavata]